VIGRMIENMEKENFVMLVDKFIKEILETVKRMVEENILLKMD
jgi:hypothetical protein